MFSFTTIQSTLAQLSLYPLLVVGIMTFLGFYLGKTMKFIKLPSIIGFMLIGVILGPSLLNIATEGFQIQLSFMTDVALSFVAVSIGIELSFKSLKKQGKGIIIIILLESILTFIVVTAGIYLFTKDLPLALIFGSIAPASAPAGTVAIIQEYKARGSLTKALYAVVGFDDGLGIIIFGFASAIAKSLLVTETGGASLNFIELMSGPLLEVILSIVIGTASGLFYILLARKLTYSRDIFILTFSVVLINAGLCSIFGLSVILTNMVLGIIVVNTQPKNLIEKISKELSEFMPLIFILFFVLAGTNLHIAALPSLGLIGLIYVLCRTAGLMGGAALGGTLGKMEPKIRKYLGMGILSQAGVAIGLSLIVKKEFMEISPHGSLIGASVITTITATCIFFEIIGPILTKIGLEKSGEIKV